MKTNLRAEICNGADERKRIDSIVFIAKRESDDPVKPRTFDIVFEFNSTYGYLRRKKATEVRRNLMEQKSPSSQAHSSL